MDVVERPLSSGTRTLSRSAFSLLFSEVFMYEQGRASSTGDLEDKCVVNLLSVSFFLCFFPLRVCEDPDDNEMVVQQQVEGYWA